MNRLIAVLCIFLSLNACQKNELSRCNQTTYKGKLVVKGICLNYVIQLVEGDLDSELYEQTWMHEFTSETYQNVFALESVCSFPQTIEEGDEFYFILEDETDSCAVCEAYSPVPSKRLSIKVCE